MEENKVVYTGSIPQCPYCKKPTQRTGGLESSTLMYYPPVYDKSGKNINPDRNTKTRHWYCSECDKDYLVSGNDVDGFTYETKEETTK